MEHRWGQRIALKIPVQITFADRSLERKAELTNLSITGAFIKVDAAPRTLSRLEILIEASVRYANDSLSIGAYVARYHRLGLGVEWCGPGSRRLIELLRLAVAQSLASDAPTAPGVRLSSPPGLNSLVVHPNLPHLRSQTHRVGLGSGDIARGRYDADVG